MGYKAYSQLVIGTSLFNIVQEEIRTKLVDVKDYIDDRVIGTKQIITKYYIFNNQEYTNLYDIVFDLKDKGLEIFYTNADDDKNYFVGIGYSTTYKNNVIPSYLEKIQTDINKVKPILESLGYIGEIGIYSILYESY